MPPRLTTTVDDPIHSSRRALGGSKMPASDLNNVNRVFVLIASILGVLIAVILVQSGANSKTLAQWTKLPGDMFMNAMLCIIVPTICLNSVLASMHFWTLNKGKALGYKMLAFFFGTTLWASTIGMLVAVCCVPLFNQHNLLQTVNSVTVGKAAIRIRCPGTSTGRNATSSLVLQDGAMQCIPRSTTANGTLLLLQDLSGSFRLAGDSRHVASLADIAMNFFESFFPANAFDAFLQGNVLNVIVMGVALGAALIHRSSVRTREATPGYLNGAMTPGIAANSSTQAWAGQIFVLAMQWEVILSVILRYLLRALPFAMVFIVTGGILDAHTLKPINPKPDLLASTQDLVMLFGVLLFASLLDLATVMAMAMLLTKSNPIKYMTQLVPAQLVALSTSSSLVALPTTVRSIAATKQVSMPLAHFVCSTGIVLNKNGTALYLSIASVYILTTSGLRDDALSTVNLVLLTLASALCAPVVPSMPRGSVAMLPTILSGVFGITDGSHLSQMVLFLSVMDWLLDPFVTALNVTNDCLIALILAVQMDESFIESGVFEVEVRSDTQEEDSNDGFPLDESDRLARTASGGVRSTRQRAESTAHGTGTVRSVMMERMSSVGESLVSV